jgi:predicted ATPase
MKLKSISFENYKAFKEKQTLEIRPITILIGKNSSGKSAIAKLFTLLENSLSNQIKEPLLLNNNGVELGAEFLDLVYGKIPNSPIKFTINFNIDKSNKLRIHNDYIEVDILKPRDEFYPIIERWENNSMIFYNRGTQISYDYKIPSFEGISIKGFRGILPEWEITTNKTTNHPAYYGIDYERLITLKLDYIGPFRIVPKRMFDMAIPISSEKTGIQGENAYNYLIRSEIEKTELIKNVGQWYKNHFDSWELKVSTKRSPYFEILLCKEVNGQELEINIADTGQGISQALPLVVRAFTKEEDSIIVLEQPELHLHPAAHADLAELFAWSAKTKKQSFIIETHSENILLRLRKLVVENNFGFTKDDVIIYWVDNAENGGQQITPITIDVEGTLSTWPDGVFTENVNEIIEMRKTLKKKKAKDNDTKI